MPASNQREPNLPSEPWEPEVILLLMSLYFNLTLGKKCVLTLQRAWVGYGSNTLLTAVHLKKIIKKLSLVGASLAHYTLTTSLILKFPSLISSSEINDTVKLVNLFWLCATPCPPLPVTCHLQCVLATCQETCTWFLSGTSILPRLVGVSHLFSAAHTSCPGVHGITAVLTAWVTLNKTLSVGSGVLTAV